MYATFTLVQQGDDHRYIYLESRSSSKPNVTLSYAAPVIQTGFEPSVACLFVFGTKTGASDFRLASNLGSARPIGAMGNAAMAAFNLLKNFFLWWTQREMTTMRSMIKKMMMPTSQRMITVSDVEAFNKNDASYPSWMKICILKNLGFNKNLSRLDNIVQS